MNIMTLLRGNPNRDRMEILILLVTLHASVAAMPQVEQALRNSPALAAEQAQVVELNDGEEAFIALYQRAEQDDEAGTVVILHDRGGHPAWPEVVTPLRLGLPRYGWSVLAPQLPPVPDDREIAVRPGEALASWRDNTRRRIATAIAHLRGQGIQHIVLAGYGQGADAALDYLRRTPEHRIAALVSISPYPLTPPSQAAQNPQFQFPVNSLDLYGERDLPAVRRHTARRALAARRAGLISTRPPTYRLPADASAGKPPKPTYRRLRISGADHGFLGFEEPLLKHLVGWLRHNAGL